MCLLFWSEWRGCNSQLRWVPFTPLRSVPNPNIVSQCTTSNQYTTSKQKICQTAYFLFWSEWRGSNPRPFAPQTNALPGCATPRKLFVLTNFVPAKINYLVIYPNQTNTILHTYPIHEQSVFDIH